MDLMYADKILLPHLLNDALSISGLVMSFSTS